MSNIKSCYRRSQQPGYFRTVELDGEVIATIKALTRFDLSELKERAFKSDTNVDMAKYAVIRIRQALTGNEKCGLMFTDEKVTEELVVDLEDDIFDALSEAIGKLDGALDEQREGIEKN